MSNYNYILSGVPPKTITRDKLVEFIGDEGTKRINFATNHSHALKKKEGDVGGVINLPFRDTIEPIMKNKLGTDLFPSKYEGVWRGINSDEEYARFEEFIKEYNEIVFLRDNLDLSLALSMNYDGDERTAIGELEYQAKFHDNEESEEQLTKICYDCIDKLPFMKESDYICAMPSSDHSKIGLPNRIVANLKGFDFEDISDKVKWTSKTRSNKDAKSPLEKLENLEESGLEISKDVDLNGKTVLLFDDLYMSGVSMQYVAMKLKEAGANRVFGLCTVKSRSNSTR